MIRANPISATSRARTGKMTFNVHTRQWMGNVLFVTDMLSLLIAIVLSMRVHPKLVLTIESPYISIFLLLGSTTAYLFLRRGLYPPVGMHYADELRHSVVTTSLAFLIVIGVTFALKTTAVFSRLELIGAWILCLPLIPFGRYIVRRSLIRLGLWGESVVIVGDLQKARSIADYFKTRLQYGILPVAVLSDESPAGDPLVPCPRLPICTIKVFARHFSVKTVLIVVDDLNAIEEIVKRYRNAFQWVILIKDHYSNFGLTFLKPLDFMDVFGLQVKNNLLSNSGQMPKRLMDIILSFLGLLCLTPFLLLFALMIKLESPGRVFYRQLRMGKNGLRFNLLKFRTMYQNSAALLKEELEHDPVLKQEWERYQKIKDDPRITCVGKFLRRFSLDELPQLWNVLKGEMSLVGPRPMMVDQVEMYGETIRDFFRVKPGMTGLWQVSGRNQTTFARRAELDLEYIQRWSVWLDIYIMLKTVKIVIWREGAY